MTGRIIQPLFSFDSIFNEEIGLIDFIQNFCADSDMWYPRIKEDIKSDMGIPHILSTRVEENPLSAFVKDEYKDDIDDLYKDFMNPKNHNGLYMKAILSHSPLSAGITNIFTMAIRMGSINPTVFVRNEYEREKLNKVFNKSIGRFSIVDYESKAQMRKEVLSHDSFILRNVSDVLDLYENGDEEFIVGCTFYIADTGYNRKLIETDTGLVKGLLIFNTVNYYYTGKNIFNQGE